MLNVLVDSLSSSQIAFYAIQCANAMCEQGVPVVLFYEKVARPCLQLLCPSMSIVEAWAQRGVTIATSLSTAARLIQFPGPHAKYYYAWDTEGWLAAFRQYGGVAQIFRNPSLHLIARNIDQARVIENNYNVRVASIFDNFDVTAIKSFCKERS